MKLSSFAKSGAAILLLATGLAHATGMVPETSVVIVEQSDGEGAINLKNTDNFPVLLLSNIQKVPEDKGVALTITPPAARVEPGKTQRVRFMISDQTPMTTEHLARVTFEGVPPQQKDKNEVRMTIRQNLPVLIRPAGLAKNDSPWKGLTWMQSGDTITVSNTTPYVVRLGQGVQTLPDNTNWLLPTPYVLPGQTLSLKADGAIKAGRSAQVRISPATTWGYTVKSFDATLAH